MKSGLLSVRDILALYLQPNCGQKIAWAGAERPQHFLLITSSYLSNSTRTWLNKMSQDVPFRSWRNRNIAFSFEYLFRYLANNGDFTEPIFTTTKIRKVLSVGFGFYDINTTYPYCVKAKVLIDSKKSSIPALYTFTRDRRGKESKF